MAKVKIKHRLIKEELKAKKRLGRHIEHDPRSREYAFGRIMRTSHLKTVRHRRYGSVLDQGNIGSCTGNAVAQALNTKPLHTQGSALLGESIALDFYKLATELDEFPGIFPPDDTGSSGLSAAKAAQQKGYIISYSHAFSIEEALAALQEKPVITGVNWYEGFDRPNKYERGQVDMTGQIRGGHEFLVRGFEWYHTLMDSFIVATNSWGAAFGMSGDFRFTVAVWEKLLDQEGDVTILVK